MNRRTMAKMGIDLIMTVLLLCQMAYMRIGESAHEWMGTAMFVLFLFHHILNRQWYKNLAKGRYTGFRILQILINTLIFLCMAGLMVSGVIMSRAVFAFLPIHGGMGFARILHMLAAYWGFILMSAHLGLHWGMIMGMARKLAGIKKPSSVRTWILRGLAGIVSLFGVYVLFKNQIPDYLFLQSQFVFFDMEQPLALFFAEYLGMMGLWACAAYYFARRLQQPACARSRRSGRSTTV